ncbi:MAG: hypothetical protein GTO14_05185, partial [Anaerolineales bacterium]|nr:hypothetical protein [Anaerolineales bacterium]
MRRGQNVGSLQNAQGPEQTSFRDNIEFLEAKQREFSFLVECAALRRAIELAEKEQLKA